MKRRRYLQLVAEHALARGRPLADALDDASSVGQPTQAEREAASLARDGRLTEGLDRLGLEPLLATVAAIEPGALVDVSERLVTLPTAGELTSRFRVVLAYLSLVLIFQALIAHALAQYVGPLFAELGHAPDLTSGLSLLSLGLLVVGLAGGAVAVSGRGMGWLIRPLLMMLLRARVAIAAAVLLRRESPTSRVIALVRQFGQQIDSALAGLGARAEDADALEEVAAFSVEMAAVRADRLAVGFKIIGSTILVFIAALLVGAVYVLMPSLAGGVL